MAALSASTRLLLQHTKAAVPVIKGPMYPGSNPELVAAVSEAGGLGVVQPISMTYLYGHDFRAGLRLIKSLTSKPFGVNFTIVPNKKYVKRMEEWMDISIDEGVKFFLTSLGKPGTVVKRAEAHGVRVYHDVHTPEVARKACDMGVNGLICLNDSMGGQTGNRAAAAFAAELRSGGFEGVPLVCAGVPLVCAGGVANAAGMRAALDAGYAGVQMGTRFIASDECRVTHAYKQAIVDARASDIVWTNKLAGTNSSVIRTAQVESGGLQVNGFVSWLLRNSLTKTLTRTLMLTRALDVYKRAAFDEECQIWQAGRGVQHIDAVKSCAEIIAEMAEVARAEQS